MSKILLNKFCQGVTNKLTYMPICKHSEKYKRLNLEFKLLKPDQSPKEAENTPRTHSQIKELEYIINLQTFKH